MAGHLKRGSSGLDDADCNAGYAVNAPQTIECKLPLPKTEPMHYIALAPLAPHSSDTPVPNWVN